MHAVLFPDTQRSVPVIEVVTMRQFAGARLLRDFVMTVACIVWTLFLVNWLFGSVAIVGDTLMAGGMLAAALLATRAGRARFGWAPVGLVTVVVGFVGGLLIGRLNGHLGAIFLAACFLVPLLDMAVSPHRLTARPRGRVAPAPAGPRPGIGRGDLRRRVLSR
jgi:hypothetical protein